MLLLSLLTFTVSTFGATVPENLLPTRRAIWAYKYRCLRQRQTKLQNPAAVGLQGNWIVNDILTETVVQLCLCMLGYVAEL